MGSIAVADSGPLHYLILIDYAEILATLFDHILIPFAVQGELLHSSTPPKVRDWINQPRSWLEIVPILQSRPISGLHRGEAEALQLAIQRKVLHLLIDDLDGRTAAKRLNLTVIGTIGLLERSAELGMLDLSTAINQLRRTSFFASDSLFDAALERDERRKRSG